MAPSLAPLAETAMVSDFDERLVQNPLSKDILKGESPEIRANHGNIWLRTQVASRINEYDESDITQQIITLMRTERRRCIEERFGVWVELSVDEMYKLVSECIRGMRKRKLPTIDASLEQGTTTAAMSPAFPRQSIQFRSPPSFSTRSTSNRRRSASAPPRARTPESRNHNVVEHTYHVYHHYPPHPQPYQYVSVPQPPPPMGMNYPPYSLPSSVLPPPPMSIFPHHTVQNLQHPQPPQMLPVGMEMILNDPVTRQPRSFRVKYTPQHMTADQANQFTRPNSGSNNPWYR